MSDSNSEEGPPIGSLRLGAPKAVVVTEARSIYSAPTQKPKPVLTQTLNPNPRSLLPSLAEPTAPKKKVAFQGVSEGPSLVISEVPTAAVAKVATSKAETVKATQALKPFTQKLKGLSQSVTADSTIPTDAPIMTDEEFKKDIALKQALSKKSVAEVEPAGKAYRPISASTFHDFMIQTYRPYSPFLNDAKAIQAFKEARDKGETVKPKELDKDACKRRDPNKLENFYYQKLVRDYVSRGTPYRGILVYHGLGTGKTCTSIAAAEALYWGGQKKIFVLTPATLSNNYRRELGKCGYFPLRQNNFWSFLKLLPTSASSMTWMTDVIGLPKELVEKQGGAWIPNPNKPSNWATLGPESQAAIRNQMNVHLNHRFKFIHYNGVIPSVLAQIAEEGEIAGESYFDNAVVIIDEIHNLIRTINGTQLGSMPLTDFIEKVEPHEATWSTPMRKQTPGYVYPRGYTLYRLLQNAVGAKIIALSATPMINYPQEFAILMNIIGGEQRMIEISLKHMSREPTAVAQLEAWAKQRPDVDFFSYEEGEGRQNILTITPVPHGFSKVVTASFETRGFVRESVRPVRESHERGMEAWGKSLVEDLMSKKLIVPTLGVQAQVDETPFKVRTMPLLYDAAKQFVATFIDRATLAILKSNVLKARATGLISFYRGGSEELMPRTTVNDVVAVPMSDYMFQEYSRARLQELDMASPATKPEGEAGTEAPKKRKGMTLAEMDLYTQATKSQQAGFLSLSRAACNWVFPEDVPRPQMNAKDQAKTLGLDQDKVIAVDHVEEEDEDLEHPVATKTVAAVTEGEGEEDAEQAAAQREAVLQDEAPPETTAKPLEAAITNIIGTLMSGLEAKADEYLNKGLTQFSPKYAEMLGRIRTVNGPVLVYSQFKTLEGLGIFAAVLRAADERFLPLDIQKINGEWAIPAALLGEETKGRPRYIVYTGDQELEKRRLLLQLYNADVTGLPPTLSAQCAELLSGAPDLSIAPAIDNRDGRICRVFMITQSGAEGISLFNTRQVHIMEPYWNNVRLQQVIGRAIRLCSHMNLPWEERTVEVFTYLSVFSDQQKATGSKQLMIADLGKTTDEVIYDIAKAKQKLADGLFEIAQSTAVDCELHFMEHGGVTECYKWSNADRPYFLYHPDIARDLTGST